MKYLGIEFTYHKCGGLGDRLCGLINIIMLSKIFYKKFFIKWEETENINKYLDYKKYDFYNSECKDLKSIRKNFLDNRDKNLVEILQKLKKKEEIDEVFPEDVLICYNNQDSSRFLIGNTHINLTLEKYKIEIFSLFNNLYSGYLKPNEYILNKVKEVIGDKKDIIGIQIRCGDAYMVKNNKHKIIPRDKDIYSILRNIKKDNLGKTFFITSDYEKVFEISKEIFDDVIYYNKKPVHCDMNDKDFVGKGNDPVDSENVDKILVDHIILSNYCSKLYISGSNFGRTAALINKTDEIYHLFNKRKLDKLFLISKLNEYNNELKKYIKN